MSAPTDAEVDDLAEQKRRTVVEKLHRDAEKYERWAERDPEGATQYREWAGRSREIADSLEEGRDDDAR